MRPGKPGRFALGRCRSFLVASLSVTAFLFGRLRLSVAVAPSGNPLDSFWSLRFPSRCSFGTLTLSVTAFLWVRFALGRVAPSGNPAVPIGTVLRTSRSLSLLSGRLRLAVALLLPGISWSSVSIGTGRLRVSARGTPYGAHPCVRVPLKQPSGIPTCERCACVFP